MNRKVRGSRVLTRFLTLFGVGLWLSSSAAADELLVSGFFSNAVSRFDAASGASLGNYQTGVGLQNAICARVGPDGLLYVCSEGTDSVQRYDPSTHAFVDQFILPGAGGLDGPTAVTWNAAGDLLVASFENDRILRYDGMTGAFAGALVLQDAGGLLNGPDNGTVVGPDGALWVPSFFGNRILRYDAQTGAPLGVFGNPIGGPRVIEFRNGLVYVSAELQDTVRVFGMSGNPLPNFFTIGSGGMDAPVGMAWGPDGDLYVASWTRDKVNRYNGTTGAFVQEFIAPGSGGIDAPLFLTFVPEPASALTFALALALGAQPRRR